MIKLIVGVKGTGKTKNLVDEINKAANESHGAVVCVEYNRKLTYDINYRVRLVDAADYGIDNAEKLYGYVCGILAGNYDVTELFVYSALKICGNNIPEFEKFILRLNEITEKNNVHCVMTASLPAEQVPASLTVFVRDTH